VRITPELADPVGPLEVGQREDVEQLGAGSGPEGVQAFLGVGARARRVSWPQGTPSYCRGALVLLKGMVERVFYGLVLRIKGVGKVTDRDR
jgi:hypothetical protein